MALSGNLVRKGCTGLTLSSSQAFSVNVSLSICFFGYSIRLREKATAQV